MIQAGYSVLQCLNFHWLAALPWKPEVEGQFYHGETKMTLTIPLSPIPASAGKVKLLQRKQCASDRFGKGCEDSDSIRDARMRLGRQTQSRRVRDGSDLIQ